MPMIIPTLAQWYVTLLATLFVIVSAFLMLVILIQRPRGGGLSGAFGGAGGSAQAAFGTKTGDVLTYVTVACFVAFLVLAMSLTWAISPGTETGAQLEVPPEDATPITVPVTPEDAPPVTDEGPSAAPILEEPTTLPEALLPEAETETVTEEAPSVEGETPAPVVEETP